MKLDEFNFYLGAAASAWLLTVMVLLTELSAPFKDILTKVFTHHWIAKLILVTLIFIVVSKLYPKKQKMVGMPVEDFAWKSIIASLLIIFGFYIFEFLV